MFHVPEKYRTKGTTHLGCHHVKGDQFGMFVIPAISKYRPLPLRILASNGVGESPQWEHVSISTPVRCPTWDEMCLVKSLFWDDEDCVLQFHPPQSEYVNNAKNCLHLWRPVGFEIPMPPSDYIGDKPGG